MIQVADLPTLNAVLNATSALLLLMGYCFIRQKQIVRHRNSMSAALVCSTLFLTSYLIYHYHIGSRPYSQTGITRPIYFSILFTHIVLAAGLLPLVLATLIRALRGDHPGHRKIARWTLPIWLYVSVTGVVIYWMLYGFY